MKVQNVSKSKSIKMDLSYEEAALIVRILDEYAKENNDLLVEALALTIHNPTVVK